jgi:hypothetical protein
MTFVASSNILSGNDLPALPTHATVSKINCNNLFIFLSFDIEVGYPA